MTEKINFSISDAKVIEKNPNSNFAVMELDFFASGDNLHHLYVSEETLHRTANTIKNCPLVWKYDSKLDDVYTHDPEEVPCGFVPESSEIKSRVMEDGRIMLSVVAYVWKRYTGQLLDFFERDGYEKPVSVEMSVTDVKEREEDGILELLDYKFEGITILGTYVTPAIPLAKATVLSFSKEYEELYKKEFSSELYRNIDFSIPDKVKSNVKSAFEKYSSDGKISSVVLSTVRHLLDNKNVSSKRVATVDKYINKSNTAKDTMNFELLGGKESIEWIDNLCKQMEEADSPRIHYFAEQEGGKELPYSSLKDINPALKEIKPPISIDSEYDIGVKKSNKEMAMEKEELKEEMAIDAVKEDVAEAKEEEKQEMAVEVEIETDEEEKKEEKGETQEMSLFAEDFAEGMKSFMGEEFASKVDEMMIGQYSSLPALMAGVLNKMMSMKEETSTYMAENQELKKFKSDLEEQQKKFAIESTIKDLSEKVVIPEDVKQEMVDEASKYSFGNIDAWKTYCKAKSFDFAIKENGKSDVLKVGLPFADTTHKKEDLWS